MRILVADDTPIALEYLSEAVQMLGHDVVEARDGQEVLMLARSECFAALLLDVRMPGLFGDRALRQLRSDPEAASRASPAMAISSEMTPALAEQLQRDGFAAAFRKPIDLHVLKAALDKLLTTHGLAPAVAVRAPSAQVPLLDDAAAMSVLGQRALVEKLRGMLITELNGFAEVWEAQLTARASSVLREALHKLSASAAICGAAALSERIAQLQAAIRAEDWCAADLCAPAFRDVLSATLFRLRDAQQATDPRG